MNDNISPADFELILICHFQKYCTNCPKRVGCEVRRLFYLDNQSFECTIQLNELMIVSRFNVSETDAFEVAQSLREKRNLERFLHPRYSYK